MANKAPLIVLKSAESQHQCATENHSQIFRSASFLFYFFMESGMYTRNEVVLRMSPFAFFTPCRLHSPPNPPRVAAQEAVLSRKTTGSMINTVRSGPIVPSAPASASVPLLSGVRWRSVQTGLNTAK